MLAQICMFIVSLTPPFLSSCLAALRVPVCGVLRTAKVVLKPYVLGCETEDLLREKGFSCAFVFGLGDPCWAHQQLSAAPSSWCPHRSLGLPSAETWVLVPACSVAMAGFYPTPTAPPSNRGLVPGVLCFLLK